MRRHAQRIDRADAESALSAAGRAMAERLAKAAPRYALVVASPLARAKETALRISGRLDAEEPDLLPDLSPVLTERYGALRMFADVADLLRRDLEALAFAEDQLAVWTRLAERVGPRDRVLAVSHGGNVEMPAVLVADRLEVRLDGPLFGYCDGVRVTFQGARPVALEVLRTI